MKKIDAIIKPFRLDEVRMALEEVGVQGLTVTDVKGYGAQASQSCTYRQVEYIVDYLPKVKIEILIEDNQISQVVEAIVRHARTGKVGDGRIFISNIDAVTRIRTGETGRDAI